MPRLGLVDDGCATGRYRAQMETVRTPDDRFETLVDWPFEARYVTIGEGLRVHHVDEGSGPTVLLTHGEPTWSYLYRKMIPPLVGAGCRVIAPDLVGFGRSDKPVMRDDYTYGRHVRWLTETIDAIDTARPLGPITMFCQDWGGLLGLVHVARQPELYRGVVVSNSGRAARHRRQARRRRPVRPVATLLTGAEPVLGVGVRRRRGQPAQPDRLHAERR